MTTYEILYSAARDLYYIVSDNPIERCTSWVGVAPDADGKFAQKPFAFWSVRSAGAREPIAADDELVKRYAMAEEWPTKGEAKHTEAATRMLESARSQLVHAERSVEYYRQQIAALEAELA